MNVPTPRDLTGLLGTLDYYRHRAEDFKERNPGMDPPDYYLSYGHKYATRFTEELMPSLSARGREWLLDARRNLQLAIEQKRFEDPEAFAALERDQDAFLRFAYATHPRAYRQAGLAELPVADLVKIPLTPDRQDLVSGPGLLQVAQTGVGVVSDWVGTGIGEHLQTVAETPTGKAVLKARKWAYHTPFCGKVRETGEFATRGLQQVSDSPAGQTMEEWLRQSMDLGFLGLAWGTNALIDSLSLAFQLGKSVAALVVKRRASGTVTSQGTYDDSENQP